MNKSTVALIIMVLFLLVVLGHLASQGAMLPAMALFALYTVIIFMAGVLSTIYTVKIMQAKEQQSFVNNAQENLQIMGKMQSIQNQQNSQLLRQVQQLPDGTNGQEILWPNDLFDEL